MIMEYSPLEPKNGPSAGHRVKRIALAVLTGAVLCVAVFLAFETNTIPPAEDTPSSEYTHKCIHDHIKRGTEAPVVVKQNYGSQGPEMKFMGGENSFHLQATSTARKIRIKFGLDQLDNDPLACLESTTGSVAVGSSPSGNCDEDGGITTNCWYECTSANKLSTTRKDYLVNTILADARAWLESALMVEPVVGNLSLPGSWGHCPYVDGAQVPEKVADTDMYIQVVARPVFGDTLAFATDCQIDPYGRPTAGYINFKPDKVDTNPSRRSMVTGVAIHEITHALGYSWSKFVSTYNSSRSTFVDPITKVPKDRVEVVEQYQRPYPNSAATFSVQLIKTPTVLEKVREHFACPTLEGAQLEDGGDAGTALSHWEKRIFMDEFMTGTAPKKPEFSALTLALLQDSGWYYVDFNASEPLKWGYGKGCSFAQDVCSDWPSDYTCSTAGAVSCTPTRSAKGYCGVKQYTSALDAKYRYFADDSSKGGHSLYSDYCPFTSGYDNNECYDAGDVENNLQDGSTYDKGEQYGETYGNNGMCLSSSLKRLRLSKSITKSTPISCHMTGCATKDLLKVKIHDDDQSIYYDCPRSGNGNKLTPIRFKGDITCPDPIPCGTTQKVDDDWPLATHIEPTKASGKGGDRITLFGSKFTPGSKMYALNTEMEDVVVMEHNITGTTVKVPYLIEDWQDVPISIVDAQGRSASVWTMSMSTSMNAFDLNAALTALAEFLVKYAVPLTVSTLGFGCAFSVHQEWKFATGDDMEDEYEY